ncbi:hypothetical protein ScPMuIL_002457 [Solemya velum]
MWSTVVDEASDLVGRNTSFEVSVNDKLVFSKLKLGGFPADLDVVAAVKEALSGKDPKEITDAQNPCTIL